MRRKKVAAKNWPGKKRAQGFTLLEVVVGAALLMFAMAGLVPVFITGLNQSASVRYKSTATNVAREKMEEIRQLDYREITDADFLGGRFNTSEDVRGVLYTIEYGVIESGYGTGVLKEVTVTVRWTAPPKVSPVSLTTMIHQQYVGPRISRMEVIAEPVTDSLSTPFGMIADGLSHTVYCHVAESDWGLVVDNLNESGMVARDVYMKLYRVDNLGNATAFTDALGDDELTGLTWHIDGDTGLVDDVYVPYTFDASDLPDGYWEFRAMLFNQYDEPGNPWRLRIRIENGYPDMPVGFVAVPQYGDESVCLYWSGSGDEDLDHYCIQRRSKAGTDWKSWEDVAKDVDPNATSYLDEGSIAGTVDPWGTTLSPNDYQYRIWAVDIENRSGLEVDNYAVAAVTVPPASPVTTTTIDPSLTTTTVFSTTTTLGSVTYTITIENTRADSTYTIQIEPGGMVRTIGKKTSITVEGLPAGHYDITATPSKSGEVTLHASFTLDAAYDPAIPVLIISR